MNLTEQQIQSIYLLYGDAIDDADYIIDLLRKYSTNISDLFDRKGFINLTIDEFEKKLNNPFKNRVYEADSVKLDKITDLTKQIKELVKTLNKKTSLDFVSRELNMLNNSLKRREHRLIDKEIMRIDHELEYLNDKLSSLNTTHPDFM